MIHMGAECLLDMRGLELPEPLLRALAALDDLAEGDYLHLVSDRDPVLLYPLLAQQGFVYEKLAGHAATVDVLIWRVGDSVAEQAAHHRQA